MMRQTRTETETALSQQGLQRRAPVVEVIDDDTAAVLRRKSADERLKIVDLLYRLAWRLVDGNIRSEHPDWDNRQVRQATAQRIAGGTN